MHSSEVSCRIEGELWCIHGLKTKRPRKTVLKCKEICSPSFIILISIQRFKKLPLTHRGGTELGEICGTAAEKGTTQIPGRTDRGELDMESRWDICMLTIGGQIQSLSDVFLET